MELKKANLSSQMVRYIDSQNYTLTDCYKRHSIRKQVAFDMCLNIMRNVKGHKLKIVSYNSQIFTVGFYGYINNQLNFFYITPTKCLHMPLT